MCRTILRMIIAGCDWLLAEQAEIERRKKALIK
jgi:hypothetical protein